VYTVVVSSLKGYSTQKLKLCHHSSPPSCSKSVCVSSAEHKGRYFEEYHEGE